MNDTATLEKLRRTALSDDRRQRLFALIESVFKRAIEARAPYKRPSGKAGLRAEKGYYRLLYLLGELQETLRRREVTTADKAHADRDPFNSIMRQLRDIPDLQSEILAGIDAALEEMEEQRPTE